MTTPISTIWAKPRVTSFATYSQHVEPRALANLHSHSGRHRHEPRVCISGLPMAVASSTSLRVCSFPTSATILQAWMRAFGNTWVGRSWDRESEEHSVMDRG